MLIPTKEALYNKAKGILQSKTLKTFKEESITLGIIRVLSIYINNLYEYVFKRKHTLLYLERMTDKELQEVGATIFINKIQATRSFGIINVFGDIGTIISAGSSFLGTETTYISETQQEIIENKILIESITRNGTLAIAKSNSILNLATGSIVSISGFTETNFNKNNVEITILNDYEFSYDVEDTGDLNDTNGILSFNGCYLNVYSLDYGLNTEISNGSILVNVDIQIGIDKVLVSFNGITGGLDIETREEYLSRLIEYQTNNRNFDTKTKIISTIKTKFPQITHGKILLDYVKNIPVEKIELVSGESANIRKITCSEKHNLQKGYLFTSLSGSDKPALNIDSNFSFNTFIGNIYDDFSFSIFVNDESSEDTTSNMSIVPYYKGITTLAFYKKNSITKQLTAQEINNIKAYIDNEILNFASSYYNITTAITQQETITITNINPNISTIKTAIQNNINQYIIDNINIGDKILKSQIDFIIKNTIDVNNNKVINYNIDITNDILPTTAINIIALNIVFN